MMDILYSVGPNPGHEGRELRWSLRSVARFGRNVGRVIVAGYPPAWLSDNVVKFPFPRREGKNHFKNLYWCVMAAIEAGVVKGDFLYSSDDHFYTRPYDVDKTPFYKKRNCIRDEAAFRESHKSGKLTLYNKMLVSTRGCLLNAGYTAVESNMHCNTRLHTADAPIVKDLDLNNRAPYWNRGVELTIMFQNVRAKRERVTFVHRADWKCKQFEAAAIASGQFSIYERIFNDPLFVGYMDREFGTPCKYEEGV